MKTRDWWVVGIASAIVSAIVSVLLLGGPSDAVATSEHLHSGDTLTVSCDANKGLTKVGSNGDASWVLSCKGTPPVSPSPTPTTTAPTTTTPTPTPDPTPTPTVTVTGSPTGFPDATNTGVPAGTSLTPVSGNLVVSTAGTIVDGKNVSGCIEVNAISVVIRNTQAQCITMPSNSPAHSLSVNAPATQWLNVSDSTITCPSSAGDGGTALGDNDIVAARLNISGCANGFDIDQGLSLTDSYIHDLFQSVSAHTDGIQSYNASNLTIVHNTIYGDTKGACGTPWGFSNNCGGTSAINFNNYGSARNGDHDDLIQNNLLAGGAFTVYCPMGSTTNVKVIGNHFSKIFHPTPGQGDKSYGYYGISDSCSHATDRSGNVDADTNAALTLD